MYRKFGTESNITYGDIVDAPPPLPDSQTQEQPAAAGTSQAETQRTPLHRSQLRRQSRSLEASYAAAPAAAIAFERSRQPPHERYFARHGSHEQLARPDAIAQTSARKRNPVNTETSGTLCRSRHVLPCRIVADIKPALQDMACKRRIAAIVQLKQCGLPQPLG